MRQKKDFKAWKCEDFILRERLDIFLRCGVQGIKFLGTRSFVINFYCPLYKTNFFSSNEV